MPNILKKEFEKRIYMYPFDAIYIQKIAHKIGLQSGEEYKLFSLMGGQELADTLPFTKYQNFCPEYESDFCLNLHLHTKHSDNILDTKDILEKANTLAIQNTLKQSPLPPFTLAFSENDMKANEEALRLLITYPQRYKNLRVVLASEFNSFWKDTKTQEKPIEFKIIYYGINPFDKEVKEYLKKQSDIDDLFNLQHHLEFGFLGLAYPQKINISDFLSSSFIIKCEQKGTNAGYEMMNRFLIALKDKGLRALEINYQFDEPVFHQAQKMLAEQTTSFENTDSYFWLRFFDNFADQYGMLKTGGYENGIKNV